MSTVEEYQGLEPGSDALVAKLVEENMGWATSIAKAVARAWNMDWQLDGLDGGAYEALLFCARRYDPARGVPFRAYARRRIHEASTQEARKSKSWQQGVGTNSQAEQDAREVSAKLFDVFPELRDGLLPVGDSEGGEDAMRSSVRQMIAGASLIAAFREAGIGNPESAVEYKQMLQVMAALDPVHQAIIWAVYWQGQSMRSLAEEWEIDDLSVIREHKEILEHLCLQIEAGRTSAAKPLKVRRGLRAMALQLRRSKEPGPFVQFLNGAAAMAVVALLISVLWFFGPNNSLAAELRNSSSAGNAEYSTW
jgi:DNA-directed RNA polymerase specialized sigma subunit